MSVQFSEINDLEDRLNDLMAKNNEDPNIYEISQALDELIFLYYQKKRA